MDGQVGPRRPHGTDRQTDGGTQTERWGYMCRHMRTNRQLGTYGQVDGDTGTGQCGHMDRQKGKHGQEYGDTGTAGDSWKERW